MRQKFSAAVFLPVLLFANMAHAQADQTAYPTMAPVEQYLIADQNTEIALARSAAPASISDHAEILVLGPHGYNTAVKGTNGFTCFVERSWTKAIDDHDFWDPKIRAPFCVNAAAAQSYLPTTILKTKLILEGKSKTEMFNDLQSALDQKTIPAIEPGAMCYMMSKQGYLDSTNGHWRPHLMFFTPLVNADLWGANLEGSPLFAAEDKEDRITIFMVPVSHWSDGTPDTKPAD
jgi:hypothetical protein